MAVTYLFCLSGEGEDVSRCSDTKTCHRWRRNCRHELQTGRCKHYRQYIWNSDFSYLWYLHCFQLFFSIISIFKERDMPLVINIKSKTSVFRLCITDFVVFLIKLNSGHSKLMSYWKHLDWILTLRWQLTWFLPSDILFFPWRLLQPETPWPNVCMAPCLTGLFWKSTKHCSPSVIIVIIRYDI